MFALPTDQGHQTAAADPRALTLTKRPGAGGTAEVFVAARIGPDGFSQMTAVLARKVVVAGTPAGVVWWAQGRIVGSSAGILVVLASVTVIEAEHASERIKVPVQKNLSWSPWPRSTLSIRGDAGRVLIGQHSYDVPTPVFIIAGRYFVQHTAANGRISAYTVSALPAEAVLDLKAAR